MRRQFGRIRKSGRDANEAFDAVSGEYFRQEGDEYAILTDSIDEDTTGADRVDCYVMKIVPTTDESGEELEEFVPVEDQKLEAKLMEIATLKLNDDEQADDED